MNQQEQIDEIVAMLDQFMDEGGGHMNITVDETLTTERVQVKTYNSTACQQGMACQIPTIELEGDDQYE